MTNLYRGQGHTWEALIVSKTHKWPPHRTGKPRSLRAVFTLQREADFTTAIEIQPPE